MIRIRRALFSLTDKTGAAEFALALCNHGTHILSTGNTARVLREAGVKVEDVSDFTGFPEILVGRLKTLHPKIHGGLLGRRKDSGDQAQMAEHGIEPIDLVAVNLYPFEAVTRDPDVALEQAIENIDIGGPTMIRSAAKNHRSVAVVVDPADYPILLEELERQDFQLSAETLRRLANKAFLRTATYDGAISRFLTARSEFGAADEDGPGLGFLSPGAGQTLRYGENPHQRAAFHPLSGAIGASVSRARKLSGKEMSYNNFIDSDAAFELVREFSEAACVIVKHTNPCGAAIGETPAVAFDRALEGDSLSAFGGIVAFNRPVDESLAERIAGPNSFFECVIAPEFQEQAVELLTTRRKWGRNVRLLATGAGAPDQDEHEVRKIRGGLLVQESDRSGPDDPFELATDGELDEGLAAELRFAWLVVKHVKSNAIVLVRDRRLVGVGAGQMSRVDSVELAVKKAGDRAAGAVLASDAFFPFRDGVDAAARAGVVAVVQPGGSMRDEEVIQAATAHGVAMVLTGVRHFRH